MRELGGEVVSAGLVDTEQGARAAGDLFASSQVDLVLCHAVTYATSSTVLPVIQAAKVPAVLLGLQPTPTLDYAEIDTAEWLANCAACCVPEIAGALTRARIPYDTVAGTIEDDPRAWEKIGAWVRAAGVARSLRRARLGFMGHTYPGMLDLYSDFTAVHAQLGAHVEVLEIDDLGVRVDAASDADVTSKIEEIRSVFSFADPSSDPLAGPVTDEQLDWSARVAVGLDKLADGLRARRADVLLPGRRQRGRAARRGRDRRQLAAHRARRDHVRRGRPEDQHRAGAARPARRRRLVHRVLRAGLLRGVRADGPRRPGAHRDRAGAADAAGVEAVPRQARHRA